MTRYSHGFIQKPSGAAFSPDDLSGLQYWHDASDAATLTLGAADVVDLWEDKSGNGVDLAPTATASEKPVYDSGNDAVTFARLSSQRIFASSLSISMTNGTMFIVIKSDEITRSNDLAWVIRAGGEIFDLRNSSNKYQCFNRASSGDTMSVNVAANGDITALVINYSSSGNGDMIDDEGTSATDVGIGTIITPATQVLYGARDTGGGLAWDGSIYEGGMYDVNHSAGDRTDLMDYLRDKWI